MPSTTGTRDTDVGGSQPVTAAQADATHRPISAGASAATLIVRECNGQVAIVVDDVLMHANNIEQVTLSSTTADSDATH
jgi:hypothetical protein